jgi:hypothetical protein
MYNPAARPGDRSIAADVLPDLDDAGVAVGGRERRLIVVV